MSRSSSSSSEGTVTVEYLLQRRVRLDWQEAVAVTLETAEVIDRAGKKSAPMQRNIVLTPTGTVELSRGRMQSGSAVSAFAQMLTALLPKEHPTQLRLILSTAGPNSSSYKTLGEFSEALKYFERPGRRNMLVEVHARALQTPVPVDAPAKVETVKKAAAKKKPGRLRGALAPLVGVAAVFGIIAAGVMFVEYRNPGVVSGPAEQLQGQATAAWDIVRGNAAEDLAGLVERVRQFGAELESEETAESGVDAAAGLVNGPSSVSELARAAAKTSPARSAPLPGVSPVSVTPARAMTARGPDPLLMAVVFDTTDTSVMPAKTVNRFSDLPPGRYEAPKNNDGLVEAVVSATGRVESAKLIHPPNSIHESMILSAIKTWQFEPAVKDGRPVRYRKLIQVEVP